MFYFSGFAFRREAGTIEVYSIGFPHSEIPGSKVATHLPEAYRRYAASFIAALCQGIHHTPLSKPHSLKDVYETCHLNAKHLNVVVVFTCDFFSIRFLRFRRRWIEKPLFGSGLRNSNKLAYFSRFFGVASYQPSGANYIERRKLVNPPIRPRDQGLGTRE